MALIVEEIKTFNKGLNPIGTPYWLTAASKRQDQLAGSVCVSFPTEEQANRAIKHKLYIAGISVRVDKYHQTASTSQCTKCGGFGHLNSLCKKKLFKCLLCSEAHAIEQHYCPICKNKGKKCLHLVPKCTNCQGSHPASEYAKCEVYQALKSKRTQDQPIRTGWANI